jgi:hypothetical protein
VARVAAGAGIWRRIVLPDGRTGFVRADELTEASRELPLRELSVPVVAALRTRPDSGALAIGELPSGTQVDVIGTFGDWQWVALRDSVPIRGGAAPITGWIPAIFRDL